MKFEIKDRWEGKVLYADEAESFSALVEAAIKAKANLQSADLQSADLQSANLQSANLQSANLQSANLQSANLQWANLQSANLQWANLQWANLQWANLQSANLPAPTLVLLASWGVLSEELTADLMLLDSLAHPSPEAFKLWADGGPCPYEGAKIQRIANFTENKHLWGKGKPDTIYNLMMRVIREKCKQPE